MTDADTIARLAHHEYAPGYSIRGEILRDGPALVVEATVPSSETGDPVDVRIVTYIPPACRASERALDEFVHWRLERIAVHEVDEWHRVDGHPVIEARHGEV